MYDINKKIYINNAIQTKNKTFQLEGILTHLAIYCETTWCYTSNVERYNHTVDLTTKLPRYCKFQSY